jgi:undecaprenyl-diphosphatase
MTLFEAAVLGFIQGLTEFLPISSSGHLVLFQHFFGLKEPLLAFDVALHLGTLGSVFIYFAGDIRSMILDGFKGIRFTWREGNLAGALETCPGFHTAVHVLIASVPTAVIGIVWKDEFEAMFGSMRNVAWGFWVTAAVLASLWLKKDGPGKALSWKGALVIGVAQGIAIAPAISRSAMTIAAALWCGMKQDAAAKFSFYLAIVAILGAAVLEAGDLGFRGGRDVACMIVGMTVSFFAGWMAIAWLMRLLRRGKFQLFAVYCVIAGMVSFMFAAS